MNINSQCKSKFLSVPSDINILDFTNEKNQEFYKDLQCLAKDIFELSADELLDRLKLPKINITDGINKLLDDIVNTKIGNVSIKETLINSIKEIEKTINRVLFNAIRNKILLVLTDINDAIIDINKSIYVVSKDIQIISDLVNGVLKDYDIVSFVYLFLLPNSYTIFNFIYTSIPFIGSSNISIESALLFTKISLFILAFSCTYLFISFILN